jgi:hypothetical protein
VPVVAKPSSVARIEIRLPGQVRISVPTDCEASHLAMVLRAIEQKEAS